MIKKIWIFILYKLYRSLLESSIPHANHRTVNIQEIFETNIFWMPDICSTYDHYFAIAKRHKKWYETYYRLHEHARRITIIHLTLIYKNKLKTK